MTNSTSTDASFTCVCHIRIILTQRQIYRATAPADKQINEEIVPLTAAATTSKAMTRAAISLTFATNT